MDSRSISPLIDNLVSDLGKHNVMPELLKEIAVKLKAHYQKIEYWTELAYALRKGRNYHAAKSVYEAAMLVHENSAILWNNYGVLLKEWGQLEEALRAYDHAISLDPEYPLPLTSKGKIMEELHQFDEAIVLYNKSLEIGPPGALAYNNIGCCYLGKKNPDDAIIYFLKALDVDPNYADSLFNLASLYINQSSFEKADGTVKKLLQLLPNDPEVLAMRDLLTDISQADEFKIEVPSAKSLHTGMSPEVVQLGEQLSGNPRSVFISYAWTSTETKTFALKLCDSLTEAGFAVVLDQNFNYDIVEILYLLCMCQNVVMLNDVHYAESCLLGKVPVTQASSPYPSFSFPVKHANSMEYIGEVFKLSAVTWEMARILETKDKNMAAATAIELANPDYYKKLPGLRLFIEGWRVDEIQMIFSNLQQYRSFSVAYLGGENCLAGYPVFDFSKAAYYPHSFNALLQVLDITNFIEGGLKPPEFNVKEDIDWSDYIFKDSEIMHCRFWKIAEEKTLVWRPSFVPQGGAAAVIQAFTNWEPL
jgi:tetratricopeptide (TPR) repeat protein